VLMPVDREALASFPALDGPNTASEEYRNLFPGVQPVVACLLHS